MLDTFILLILGIGMIVIAKAVKIIAEKSPEMKRKTIKDETPI